MKSLKEALVHKHMDRYQSFTKKDLKSGYVVRYRGQSLAMYMDHDTTAKITSITSIISPGDMFVFCNKKYKQSVWFMRLDEYNDNLIKERTCSVSEDFDIMEIYPVKTYPMLLDQDQLLHLIKNVNPIKINQ